MPAFLFLLVMTAFGSTTLHLLVSLPGTHTLGAVLVGGLTVMLAGLTLIFRPRKAPEAVVKGYPLAADLATLNAALWLDLTGEFHTLHGEPIFGRP